MQPWHALIFASLYTAAAAFANPSGAQALNTGQIQELEAMRDGEMRKLVVHEAPVDLIETSFSDPDGNELFLSDTNGSLRLVNFWATWCAPCRQEKPSLDALNATMAGEEFGVIAIATGRNTPEAIARFNEDVGIVSLATYTDAKSRLASAMNVPGLPVTVVLNREGAEIARLMGGADWDSDSARRIINYLIAAGQ